MVQPISARVGHTSDGAVFAPLDDFQSTGRARTPTAADPYASGEITILGKTNDEFLRAIFGELEPGTAPAVTFFEGNPKDDELPKWYWKGQEWRAGDNTTARGRNGYFTLATYAVSTDGKLSRKEANCRSIYGVMLDDIGTKAASLERLKNCPPSILIETSPGNYQASYLFDVPQTDLEAVKNLNHSMVAAGLCDEGAKSPPTRWGRLPFAVNGKFDPAFECRLVEFHPDRRYTIDQIVEGLGLDLTARRAPAPAPAARVANTTTNKGDVWQQLAYYRDGEDSEAATGESMVAKIAKSIGESVHKKPDSPLAKEVELLKSRRRGVSESDHGLRCEIIRRGAGNAATVHGVLLKMAGGQLRDKIATEKQETSHSESAAKSVLEEISIGGHAKWNAERRKRWANLPTVQSVKHSGGARAGGTVSDDNPFGLYLTASGKVDSFQTNARILFERHPDIAGIFRFNEWTETVERIRPLSSLDANADRREGVRPVNDGDLIVLIDWLYRNHQIKLDTESVLQALTMGSRANTVDPLKDAFNSLPAWDGVERISSWLVDHLLAESSPEVADYISEAGRCFFIGAVARGMCSNHEGVKVDEVLTIQGAKGGGKSSVMKILSDALLPGCFTDQVHDVVDPKHRLEQTRGKFIVELAELGAVRGAKDLNKLKAALTATTDSARLAYEKTACEVARRFVFVATTNESEFIAEDALTRRFYPVKTRTSEKNQVNFARLESEAHQLWAEALYRFKAGERWHIDSKSKAFDQWVAVRDAALDVPPAVEELRGLAIELFSKERGISPWRNAEELATEYGIEVERWKNDLKFQREFRKAIKDSGAFIRHTSLIRGKPVWRPVRPVK